MDVMRRIGCLLCATASLAAVPAAAAAKPVRLSDVLKPVANPSGPRPNGRYYGALFVKFAGSVPIAGDACITPDFMSYVRSWVNDSRSVSSSVTLSLRPMMNKQPAIKIPIFIFAANERPKQGEPKCFSKIIGSEAQLTTYLPSSNGTGLNLSFSLETSKTLDTKMASTLVEDGKKVSQLMASAGGAAFLSAPAAAVIGNVAGRLDAVNGAVFSSASHDEVPVTFHFAPPAGAYADAWLLSVKGINAAKSVPSLSTSWEPAITFYMAYKESVLREDSGWPGHDEIINKAMIPNEMTELNTIARMVTQGQTGGFSGDSLNAATTNANMNQQCRAVRGWASQFLIGDDALVVRYAIMRSYSKYTLAMTVGTPQCFSPAEIGRLKSLSADYVFDEGAPEPARPASGMAEPTPSPTPPVEGGPI